jgi:hypothetical protein
VHPDVVAEVLAAVGLDVVHVHLAERFDPIDVEELETVVGVALEIVAGP